MPNPIAALSKIKKAEIAKQLDEVIVVDGKEVRKATILENEIKDRLASGGGTEDIMKMLRKRGMDVPSAYVRERMALARREGPIKGDRGVDPKYLRMELNYIIDRGLANGDDWEGITKSLQDAFPNRDVSKIVEVARNNRIKKMQQASPPAIVDEGDGRNGGPREDPPVRGSELDPSGPVQDLSDMRNISPEGLLDISKRAMDEARRRRKEELAGIRGNAKSKVDWGQFDELFQAWKERDARPEVTEGTKTFPEENLDVPIEQPGFNGSLDRPQ